MIPSGMTINGVHTKNDLGLIPKRKIVFDPPNPKTIYDDIPGADGSLDRTELLTGKVAYENRKGSIDFLLDNAGNYMTAYSALLNTVHGKKVYVALDDEPGWLYTGRMFVSNPHAKEGYSSITLNYTLDPYKYSASTTGDQDWQWDDLFDVTIYYGTFKVNGSKTRTFINPTSESVKPTFTCSSIMTVNVNGIPGYVLQSGKTTNPGFTLRPGSNTLIFSGTGTVLADYSMGKSL